MNKLGCINVRRKKYEEAVDACKKAIDIKPSNYEAWYNLGNTYAELKQYDEAKEAYEKAFVLRR